MTVSPAAAVGLLALAAAVIIALWAALTLFPGGAHHGGRHPAPTITPTPAVTPPPPLPLVVAGVAREAEIRTLLAWAAPEVARTRAARDRREAETGRPWADDTGTFPAIVAGERP